ncbi:hypothetical protein DSO57_1028514 [Entomophthora muscae]|uniref:Uncharacterized protein n=1 Tax=Entomophthora muscae TaxID=34485 RepID=A0ACC2SE83_9FUNG|nr:hypothetical protein DSO57_1028514 [Entomophthora muscae]
MIEGDNYSIPNLPPLNLSASSSNSSISRKTSLPVIISDPIKMPEYHQAIPEPSLPSSSSGDFITTHTTAPSIHSATICTALPELDSTSFQSRPHSAPLPLPSSSNISSSRATNLCKDIKNGVGPDLAGCTVKDEDCALSGTLENQVNFSHKEKSQKAVSELKQRLLSPASIPSNNLSQIQQNFKPGKPITRKRSQGFDSIATSIFLIEKLASNSTLRSLAIFHYINIGKKFYELIGGQKENKHAASLFYQSVHSSLKHLRPSFDDDFAVSNQHILKLCGRGKFLFKIYDVIGSALSSVVIQHQIPLIKLTDSPKEERISLINWALANKDMILSLPGFLTSSELERLENIAYDPQPSTPNLTLKSKSSKPESSVVEVKAPLSKKCRIATPINARLSAAGSSTKSIVKRKRRT